MQGSSDVLQFRFPPEKIKKMSIIPKRAVQSEYEVSQNSDTMKTYKPVNLNPSKSGSTLATVLQGKYPISNAKYQRHNFLLPKTNPQETNLMIKIESQETNLKQKIESSEDLSNPLSRYSSVRNYQTIQSPERNQMKLPPSTTINSG